MLAAAAALSPARADEGKGRVETTVLVRINQADHPFADGSTVTISPRNVHVAWRAQVEGTFRWTVDGKQGKAYVWVGPIVFSDDGEHFAYVAGSAERALVVVDGQERTVACAQVMQETLRFVPGGVRTALVGVLAADRAHGGLQEAGTVLCIGDEVGPPFASIDAKSLTFSTDGKRSALVAHAADEQDVVVADAKAGKGYPGGSVGAPRFSADGTRYAYEVRKPDARMVVDGVEGPAFERVMPPNFAPRGARMFYVGVREAKPVVVVDGKEEPEVFDVRAPGPVWSADGGHLGYVAVKVADRKAMQRVVIDGVDGPAFQRIGAESLILSPDGKRHAYWAGNGPKPFYVVDGVAQKEADLVGRGVAFSPDSKRVAYGVQRSGKWFVVTDGVEGPPVDGVLVGFPVFTSDSSSVVYAAVLAGATHIFVDGKPGPAFDGLAEGALALGQGTSSVAVIARRGQAYRIVVDGVESTEEFPLLLPGSTLVADGPRSFRAWAARGGELLHLRATLTPGAAPR
jgi:hypothetical protein